MAKFKKMKISILAFVSALFMALGIVALIPKSAQADIIDIDLNTLYGQVKRMEVLNYFETQSDLDKVQVVSGVANKALVKEFINAPAKPAQGSYSLELERALIPSNEAMTVQISFGGEKDFSQMPIISFNVNSFAGQPGANQYVVKVTAVGAEESYFRTYGYYTNAWNCINFDMTECPYLSSISALKLAFYSNSTSEVSWEGNFQIDNMFAARMIDFRFAKEGDLQGFSANGATLTAEDDALKVKATVTSPEVIAPEMTYTKVLTYLYSSQAQMKNSIYTVIDNRSSATEMKIYYRTTSDDFTEDKYKSIAIEKNAKKLYVINFSDMATWTQSVNGFKYVFVGAKANEEIFIDNIEFHEDEVIEEYAGVVTSLTANSDKTLLTAVGTVNDSYRNNYYSGKLNLYANYVDTPFSSVIKSEPIDSIPVSSLVKKNGKYEFEFKDVNFIKFGNKTYADHYFTVALVLGSNAIAVDKDRGIDNWADFVSDKYAFENPTLSINVLTKGAKGDGFTDDTAAIQSAIDELSKMGGGKVIIGGNKTYKVTTIRLKNNITLYLEEGSVLRQSEDFRDYDYNFELGHNSIAFSHINWSHCNVVSNYPMILANDVKNVKVLGGGTIVMSDADNYGDDIITQAGALEHLYSVCSHRLHSMPIGMYNCNNVEISDLIIHKSSGYHICVTFCQNMTIYDVEMARVKCASSDGISLGGANNVYVEGAYLNGNDDGIVLSSVYEDPRELWHFRQPGNEQAARNIEIYSSYVASGGGKAISVITWGTSDPEPTLQEIRNIKVKDCTLSGGYSVGVWPDNPYNGKQPFDNSEVNDFSAIKDFTIVDNEYLSPVNLWPVVITGLITDSGINGSSEFVNAEFDKKQLYWTMDGNAQIGSEYGDKFAQIVGDGSVTQGLWLNAGEYLIKYSAKADKEGAFIVAIDETEGQTVAQNKVKVGDWDINYLFLVVPKAGNYRIGLVGADGITASADSFSYTAKIFSSNDNAIERKELYSDFDTMPKGFVAGGTSWSIVEEDGNGIIRQTNNGVLTSLMTEYAGYTDFTAETRVRFDSFNGVDNMFTVGIRNASGASYVAYFSPARNQTAIRKDKNGEAFLSTTSYQMTTGVWYDIKVTCETLGNGVKITLYVDGEPVLIGTDTTNIIAKGALSLGCYNCSVSIDSVYVTAMQDTDKIITANVVDEKGNPVPEAKVTLYSNGVLGGEYVSSSLGEIALFAEDGASVYYTAKKFGYEPIERITKLDVNTPVITLKKAKNVLVDEFENDNYLENVGSGFSVENGKLVQSDGASNVQTAFTYASGFGDFTTELNLRYTGGNAGPGNNVTIAMYKGSDKVLIQWQPYYGLFAVYKQNVSEGQDFHASAKSDAIMSLGAEITLVFGTENKKMFLTAYVDGEVLLETEYQLSYGTDSTRIQYSSWGIEFESDYIIVNAEKGAVVSVQDVSGRVVEGVTVSQYNGSTLVESAVTNSNGVATFNAYEKGNIYKVTANGIYGECEVIPYSSVVNVTVPYKDGLLEGETGTSTFVDTLDNTSFGGAFNAIEGGINVSEYGASGKKAFTDKTYGVGELSFTLGEKDFDGNPSTNVRVVLNGVFFYYTPQYGWLTLCAAENDFVSTFKFDRTVPVKVRIVVEADKTSLYASKIVDGTPETETLVRTINKKVTQSQISISAYKINCQLLDMKYSYQTEKFTVVFVDGNGSVVSTQSVFDAKDITEPNVSAINGFVGWDTDLNSINSSCVVKAVTAESSYTVTFKDKSGNVIDKVTAYGNNPIAYVPSVTVGALEQVFGWEDQNGNAVDVFAIRENTVVTVVISSVKHKITFVDSNGKLYTIYVADGAHIVAPDMDEVVGYTFSGYEIDFDVAERDMVIYANYTPNNITVIFNDENGNKVDETTISYGSVAIPPVTKEKENYVFVGYDKPLSGITENTTFTAVYKEKTFEVIFFDYYENVISSQEIAFGNSATAPELADDANNIFKGWDKEFNQISAYTEVRPVVNTEDVVDVTLVNTLAGTTDVVQMSKEAPHAVQAPTASGYIFGGWYYDATLTEKCNLETDKFDGNIYLYTKWIKIVSATVTSVNGSVSGLPNQFEEGKEYSFTVAPDNNFKVERVTVAGKVVEEKNGKYTFTAPSADFTVNVTYAKAKKGCGGNASMDLGIISVISIALCLALKKGKVRA